MRCGAGEVMKNELIENCELEFYTSHCKQLLDLRRLLLSGGDCCKTILNDMKQ